MNLIELQNKIYEMYEIEPTLKIGDKYYTADFRFAERIAEENMYPRFYDYTYLRLLAYLSQNQEWERFELPIVGTHDLKGCILEWYLRNKHMVSVKKVQEIIKSPMNVEVI